MWVLLFLWLLVLIWGSEIIKAGKIRKIHLGSALIFNLFVTIPKCIKIHKILFLFGATLFLLLLLGFLTRFLMTFTLRLRFLRFFICRKFTKPVVKPREYTDLFIQGFLFSFLGFITSPTSNCYLLGPMQI